MISEERFNELFRVVPNSANGNCLFESMEFLLRDTEYAKNYKIPTPKLMRAMLGKAYKKFDISKEYPEDTLEYKIKLGILYDNVDENGALHHNSIKKDKVWASMTDVLLCAWLFGINIHIYVKIEDKYEFHEIEHSEPYSGTVALLYRDRNHFEALDAPQDDK